MMRRAKKKTLFHHMGADDDDETESDEDDAQYELDKIVKWERSEYGKLRFFFCK